MDILSTVVSMSGLVFVLASMLAMGLSLTLPQIMARLCAMFGWSPLPSS